MKAIRFEKIVQPWITMLIYGGLFALVIFLTLDSLTLETTLVTISVLLIIQTVGVVLKIVSGSFDKRLLAGSITRIKSEDGEEDEFLKVSFPDDLEKFEHHGVARFKMEV